MSTINHLNQFVHADCLTLLRDLEDCSIAACITDPPYNYEFVGHNWDETEIKRRVNRVGANSSTLVKNIPYGSGLAGGVRNPAWYRKNRENILSYQEWCREWATELYRILKPGAFALVFNSTRTVAHVQVAFEDVGFYARDVIVWRRHSGIPKGLNFQRKLEQIGDPNSENWRGWHSALRNEWEAIVVLQKPLINNYLNTVQEYGVGLYHAEQGDGFLSNIIEGVSRESKEPFNTHPTVKPLDLMKRLVGLVVPKSCENIVLDPFGGSGTTAVACVELGIPFISCDISEDYVKIANQRIVQSLENRQLSLFD